MIIVAFVLFAAAVYLFIHLIVKRDHGHKEPVAALFFAMGYGVLAVVLASILNNLLVPSEVIESVGGQDSQALPVGVLAFSALAVGVVEESVKAIPLALFIYKKRYFNELTDGIIYFGIVGLTFGIIEDIMYTLEFGGGVGIMRIIFLPYLHAGLTILFGFCLAQKKVLNRSWMLPAFGLASAILIHALYDFFAFLNKPVGIIFVLIITVAVNTALFVLFRRAQRADEVQGRSAVGINKFCRHCGQPNPKRLLYCSQCGKHS